MQTDTENGPGQRRPALRTRDGKPLEVAARRQLFWILLVACVLVAGLQLPFRLAGLVFGIAAIWTGATVLARLARARRIGVSFGRSWPVGVGLGLVTVMTLGFVLDAAFYPIMSEREACVAGANTHVAQQACEDDDPLVRWAERVLRDR